MAAAIRVTRSTDARSRRAQRRAEFADAPLKKPKQTKKQKRKLPHEIMSDMLARGHVAKIRKYQHWDQWPVMSDEQQAAVVSGQGGLLAGGPGNPVDWLCCLPHGDKIDRFFATIKAATESGFRMQEASTLALLYRLRYDFKGMQNTFPDRKVHEPVWTYLVQHHLPDGLRKRVWLGLLAHSDIRERERLWTVPTDYHRSWMNSRWLSGHHDGIIMCQDFYDALPAPLLRELEHYQGFM